MLAALTLFGAPVAAPMATQLDGLRGATFDAAKFATGEGGNVLAHGDLDGDGWLDLVVPNSVASPAAISILHGRGDGTFDTTQTLASIDGATTAALGDVDGDGDLDVVVGRFAGTSVFLHRNEGGRTYGPATPIASVTSLGELALGRVDSDGVLDLVTSNFSARVVEVRRGDGTGGLLAPLAHSMPFDPLELALGDFDLDTHLDLAVLAWGGLTLTVSLGDGSGSFGAPSSYPMVAGTRQLVLRDATDDGLLDVLGVDPNGDAIVLRAGSGGGSLGPPSAHGVGDAPNSVEVADLDGDGRADLVVTRESTFDVRGGRIVTLLGQGGGVFGTRRTYPCGSNPSATVVADFDGDGALDVAARNSIGRDVSIVRGVGTGELLVPLAFDLGADPKALALEDFDGDGLVDVVTANGMDLSLVVLSGDGTGQFATIPREFATGVDTRSARSADVDGDGDVDLILAGRRAFADEFAVALNDGVGGFTVAQRLPISSSAPVDGKWSLGDVTSDGTVDLVHLRTTLELAVYRGVGDGTFVAATTQNLTLGSIGLAELVDLDGDTHLDLLVSHGGNPTRLASYFGAGDGTFTAGPFRPVGMFLGQFAVGDVDGDNAADVVLAGSALTGEPQLDVWLGAGDGSFVPTSTFEPRRHVFLLELGDVDVDGDADLVTVTGEVLPDVALYTSRSDGTFGAPEHFNARRDASALGLADVDDDGNLDVAVASAVSNDVTVLLNRAAPRLVSFCDAELNSTGFAATLTGSGSRSIAADDFHLRAGRLPPGEVVVFFAGALAGGRVLPSGLLCIQSPLTRLSQGLASGTSGSASTGVSFGALGLRV